MTNYEKKQARVAAMVEAGLDRDDAQIVVRPIPENLASMLKN